MLLKMMKSKIHRAKVTRADLNDEGSIGIDEYLLRAADVLPGEAVHVWNVNSGARLETYALPSTAGSGEICLNGAAARLVQCGDLVITTSSAGWTRRQHANTFARWYSWTKPTRPRRHIVER
jgi:aspartate 1-decarboxylase